MQVISVLFVIKTKKKAFCFHEFSPFLFLLICGYGANFRSLLFTFILRIGRLAKICCPTLR